MLLDLGPAPAAGSAAAAAIACRDGDSAATVAGPAAGPQAQVLHSIGSCCGDTVLLHPA